MAVRNPSNYSTASIQWNIVSMISCHHFLRVTSSIRYKGVVARRW